MSLNVVAGQVYRINAAGMLVSTGGRVLVPPPYGGQPPPQPGGQFVAFTPGTVRPNWAPTDGGVTNVGCRVPQSQLQQINTSYTPGAGSTVQGLEIFGELLLSSNFDGTIRDCIIHGPNHATYDSGIIRGTSRNLGDALIEWCTLDGTGRESPWTDGIKGGNYHARYCVITRTNDGMGASAPIGNGIIEASRIVNGYYTAWHNSSTGSAYPGNPPSPSDMRSHSDGAQIQGRTGWVLRGNFMGGQPSSGWSTSSQLANRDPQVPSQLAFQQLLDSGLDYQDSSVIIMNATGSDPASKVGALVELNWLCGGAAYVNMNSSLNGDYLDGVTVRNNRIIRDARGATAGGYKLYMNSNCQATVTGNVYDNDNTLVPINLVEGGTRLQTS